MAYRPIQTSIHNDPYVLDLQRDYKYLFLYLLTNDNTTQCGIYEIPLKKVELETGFSGEQIFNMLHQFQKDGKIKYSMETREICVINWLKYNENLSPKTMERVRKELRKVKNPHLVLLLYDPRKPLLDKIYEKSGNHVIIDNPWKEYFKKLTDEELRDIRGMEPVEGVSIPLAYPMHTPSTITDSEQNRTDSNSYSNSEQSAETFDYSFKDIIKIIDTWNTHDLPHFKESLYRTGVNIPKSGEIIKYIVAFSPDEIRESMKNFETIWNDDKYELFPNIPDVISFLTKGIHQFVNEAKPFDRCLKKGKKKEPEYIPVNVQRDWKE